MDTEINLILTITFIGCILFTFAIIFFVKILNKIQEIRGLNISIKDLISYYKKRITETEEDKKKRRINSIH